MGVADRARQTLPSGLEIQKSSIPDSGLGVFNKGQTVPVGAHFGPYQGQMVDREEAMNSVYSWVVSYYSFTININWKFLCVWIKWSTLMNMFVIMRPFMSFLLNKQ